MTHKDVGPAVVWTSDGQRTFAALIDYLAAQPYGDPDARAREIEGAIEALRFAPTRSPVMRVCDGESIRCLVVKGRFLVYYIYYPPSASYPAGVLSIRAIKHSAMEDPAAGVREPKEGTYAATV